MKNYSPAVGRLVKILTYLFIGLLVSTASYFFLYSHVFYCQTIGLSSFSREGGNRYLSPGLSVQQRQQFDNAFERAGKRVKNFLGNPEGHPTIIVCSTPEEYRTYCHSSEGAGCSLGTPWGDSYIVLNPDGLNQDVVSHEMCHDELFARLGWWKTTTQIPQWFNEGLALMLDRRFVAETAPLPRYLAYKEEWLYLTHGAQEVLELTELKSMRGFFGGNQRHVMLAYMTAGMEVSYWLALTGTKNAALLLDAVGKGNDFGTTYTSMKKAGEAQRNLPPQYYPLR